ncbi:cytochrome P450 4C1-like isoform X2 [Artemia franciscana]|uniref:cytochrome P450 4C1-like isoform X2 n=1 Tax=Artemia franciscana TaxID=6661 RepID=UPI0032DAA4A6
MNYINTIPPFFIEYPKKYGRLYRMWLGPQARIAICGAKYAETIFSSQKYMEKSKDYDLLRPWLGDGLLLSSGNKWRSRRRLLTPAFHFRTLDVFLPTFLENSSIFVDMLEKHSAHGAAIDIFHLAGLCTLDIICECAMGVKVNAQEEDDSEYVVAVKKIAEIVVDRGFRPHLYPDFIFNLTSMAREQQKCLKILHKFTQDVIRKRREDILAGDLEDEDSVKNFLDLLIMAQLKGTAISDAGIQEEVDTFMFEGHDTTATAIAWCLYLLGQNPDVQEKLRDEIEMVLGTNNNYEYELQDFSKLKYLECCIKETLRLYPSVPAIFRNVPVDTALGEYVVPAGTQVALLLYAIHRDPEHYHEPEKFIPERFFSDEVSKRHPYAYVPFSAGARNCIGQKFAFLVQKAVISTVVRHFDIVSVDKIEDTKPKALLVIKPLNGLNILLKRRH